MRLVEVAQDLWVDPEAVVAVREGGNGQAEVYLDSAVEPIGCFALVSQVLEALRAADERAEVIDAANLDGSVVQVFRRP